MKWSLARISCFLFAGLITAPLSAVEPKKGTLTVFFGSSGPGEPDGYENASVELNYGFYDTPGGIEFKVTRVDGSVKASPRYWFEGQQVAANAPPPRKPWVEFTGTISRGGTQIATFSFLGSRGIGDSGDFQVIGSFPKFLGKNYTEADKKRFLDELTVWTDISPRYLTNPAIAAAVRAERAERAKAKKEAETAAKTQREEQAKAKADPGYAKGDFWGGTPAPASGAAVSAPSSAAAIASQYARTSDGRYVSKGSDGKYREVGADEYNAAKQAAADERKQEHERQDALHQDRQVAQALDRQRQQQEKIEEWNRLIDLKKEGFDQSFYAAERARGARDRIAGATRLEDDYESIDQLEADIDRGMREIDQGYAEIDDADREYNEGLNKQLWQGGDATQQAIGNAATLIGNMMSRSSNEAKREQAKRDLQARGDRKREQLMARQRAQTIEARKKLIARYHEGNVPLSWHKVDTDVLYFFSYTLDKNTIEQERPVITLANIFPVGRHGDGTWPYKHGINRELRQLAPGENTLVGYYATRELAEQEREAFVRVANKARFVLKEIQYAGRPRKSGDGTSTAGERPDFWQAPESGKKETGATDFWDSSRANDSKKKTGSTDFWK